jgi:hypothetical protein
LGGGSIDLNQPIVQLSKLTEKQSILDNFLGILAPSQNNAPRYLCEFAE